MAAGDKSSVWTLIRLVATLNDKTTIPANHMNTQACLLLFLSLATAVVGQNRPGEVPKDASGSLLERGPHHRRVDNSTKVIGADGRQVEHKSSYVELIPGLHYFKDDAWHESKAEFNLFPQGAVAEQGPIQLILTPDIAQEGSVDFLTPDGKRFRSSPRWLVYHDRSSGDSIMIAAVKSCVGELVSPNVVIYPDAFDDVRAALRYTYQPWGVEQDVILLESDPFRPSSWGFRGNPANVVLEMWTEFHEAPEADSISYSQDDGMVDTTLDFEATRIGSGKAFTLGDDRGPSVPVAKTWTKVEGNRQFLIEAVRQGDIHPMLAKLPRQAQAVNPARKARGMALNAPVPTGRSALLAAGQDRLRTRERRKELASIQRSTTRLDAGVVIDYSIVTTVSNFRFKGDTTYYVTNAVTLSGTTTIDGGAVIKFANATNSGSNRLLITGPIDCQTSPYRPAIFTAKDDDTVGETIAGSTGAPGTNRYAGRALDLNAASTTYDLHDLRILHALRGVYLSASTVNLNLSHSQIGFTTYPIRSSYPTFVGRNLLIFDSLYGFESSANMTSRLEHVTFHRIGTLKAAGTLLLTNSLIISVTNGTSYSGTGVYESLSDSGIFQAVGSGARYLASQSPHRNSGVTSINSTLLSDLTKRTTYPPIVLTSDIVVDTILNPQAGRDTDVPDLGYHYDPLDWAWSGKKLTNVTLTLGNGVAVAFYDSPAALTLYTGSRVTGSGNPVTLNRIVPYMAVQEQPVLWGSAGTVALFELAEAAPVAAPVVDLNFTGVDLFQTSGSAQQDFVYSFNIFGQFYLRNCQVRGGRIHVIPQVNFTNQQQLISFTNNIFQWTSIQLHQGYLNDKTPVLAHFRNNLFRTNYVGFLNHTNTSTWTAHENVFDTVQLYGPPTAWGRLDNTNNGYYATAQLPQYAGSKLLAALDFVTGPLGSYYYPTTGTNLASLLNAGTQTANLSGLYHYTTTTNQVKETNSVVDIGFHYVAVDGNGAPLDADADGTADYAEDLSGNGSVSSGETDWTNASDFGLRVFITRPKSGSQIP